MHGLTTDEYDMLRTCVQADPVYRRLGIRSRLGALMVLRSCIHYIGEDDGKCRTMISLTEKLLDMSDAEFVAMRLPDGLTDMA